MTNDQQVAVFAERNNLIYAKSFPHFIYFFVGSNKIDTMWVVSHLTKIKL